MGSICRFLLEASCFFFAAAAEGRVQSVTDNGAASAGRRLCPVFPPALLEFGAVFLQEVDTPAECRCKLPVVFLKGFKNRSRDFGRFCPLINREVPGVLAFFTAVNQPHVHAASIGVDAEFPRIEKLQFF